MNKILLSSLLTFIFQLYTEEMNKGRKKYVAEIATNKSKIFSNSISVDTENLFYPMAEDILFFREIKKEMDFFEGNEIVNFKEISDNEKFKNYKEYVSKLKIVKAYKNSFGGITIVFEPKAVFEDIKNHVENMIKLNNSSRQFFNFQEDNFVIDIDDLAWIISIKLKKEELKG